MTLPAISSPIKLVRCRIAELQVDIPAADGMECRCRDYRTEARGPVDITICPEAYRLNAWPGFSRMDLAYMESGIQFYVGLLRFQGVMLHASAVEYAGKAYLFSGPCGVGKSTRSHLWQEEFGAVIINDDKPALRRLDEKWYAYGTPWCGKDGINCNRKVPLGAICFLKRDDERAQIHRLKPLQALSNLMSQTLYKLWPQQMEQLLPVLDQLVTEIPIFEMSGPPGLEIAALSRDTMVCAAKELDF